ncbi:MAG: ATP-binding protein [Thermodesulfobacteriota bacterium]|nr:ATP-binding protein [Thermodesulfobacteriota bacterium]
MNLTNNSIIHADLQPVDPPATYPRKWQWTLSLSVFVLMGIISFLLWRNYQVHDRLQTTALREIGEDLASRARAVNYFFQERANDIQALADSHLVSAYFVNKALGMTDTYGLKGSLKEIERQFRDLNRSTAQSIQGDERPVFDRLAMFSATGQLLVNYQVETGTPAGPDTWNDIEQLNLHQQSIRHTNYDASSNGMIFLAPIRHQGESGKSVDGYIAGWVMFDIFYQRFLSSTHRGKHRQVFDETLIYSPNTGWHQTYDLDALLLDQLEQYFSHSGIEKKSDSLKNLSHLATQHFETMDFFFIEHPSRPGGRLFAVDTELDKGIYLVRIIPKESLVDAQASSRLLLLLGLIVLTIISLAVFVLRYGTLVHALKARLVESNRLQAEVKNANISLNREIDRRKAVESQLQENNEQLEDRIKERTSEIEQMQGQLVMQEKMAAVGQLAAGVAHEINNPVGFVNSNLTTLSDYLSDMSHLITEYERLAAYLEETTQLPEAIMAQIQHLEEIKRKVDIDFILEDLSDLLTESREGLDRVKNIVLDLKDFAHPGESRKIYADINKGLDSTLNVAWNELKYKVQVIKDYGELPWISCHADQLNQVFMNLLVNAAQSIETKGEITITTRGDDDWVTITIKDTGAGIPKENLPRLFDPFFTTKAVGQGTGLGLNMAYNIIRNHDGEIHVESVVGKGTTFTIHLPVDDRAEQKTG